MTGRYGDVDYARLTKLGFALGLFAFAVGATGESAGHALYGTLAGWEDALLFDLEVVDMLLTLLSPFVFGIFLPLTE